MTLGDYWRHKIELEKTIEDYEFGYPIILAGAGACPPEDVGGFGGYKEVEAVDLEEKWR
jgi:hypothetical protein